MIALADEDPVVALASMRQLCDALVHSGLIEDEIG